MILEQSLPSLDDSSPRPFQGGRMLITSQQLIDAALTLVGPHRSISSLSLREVAKAAHIAPNSFYRHFRDIDELAVALIEQAGASLREIFSAARQRSTDGKSVIRMSIEIFMAELHRGQGFLPILLREGRVGSEAFKAAVERQLCFFEDELEQDLIRLEAVSGHTLQEPHVAARAMTRLVFSMASKAMDAASTEQQQLMDEMVVMLRMIMLGARRISPETRKEP